MTVGPTFDDVFAVMSAASIGDTTARVALPNDIDPDDPATRLAVALNVLLDDLALRTDELRRTEGQLRQAQKMEAIGRLAGGVAHDFNNLLTAILGYTMLLADTLVRPEQLEMAAQIDAAADRATALTRQLLAFGRRQIMAPKVLDPRSVIDDLAPLVRRIIGEDIEFRTFSTEEGLRVRADPTQLEQVLVNLIANARDAMPTGGVLTVELAAITLDEPYVQSHAGVIAGPHVMIAISDTGVGMREDVKDHIFEPFFTTKDTSGGTGLGLATVYGIVQQSGGSINVYSEPGKGTAFKIYLPRVFESIEPREIEPSEPASLTGTETILLAEDDAAVRWLVTRTLAQAGYRVLEAEDGPAALDLAHQHDGPIDLLVTDVVMRDMSGRQLADALVERRPGTRALFVSGYTENTIVHHGVLNPEVAFLPKPFTPATLLRKVREVLEASPKRHH